jgi:hypothetical protein
MPARKIAVKGRIYGKVVFLRLTLLALFAAPFSIGEHPFRAISVFGAGLVMLAMGLHVPVVVGPVQVKFWSGWRMRKVSHRDVLLSVGIPWEGQMHHPGAILVIMDLSSGRRFRISSVMADTIDDLIRAAVMPLADAIELKEPRLLMLSNWNSKVMRSTAVSLGSLPEIGHKFVCVASGHFRRASTKSCSVNVSSMEAESLNRTVKVELQGDKPFQIRRGSVFF